MEYIKKLLVHGIGKNSKNIAKVTALTGILLFVTPCMAESTSTTPAPQEATITLSSQGTPVTPHNAEPDLSAEKADFDLFLAEYTNEEFIKNFQNNVSFRVIVAILALRTKTYDLNINGSIVKNVRFNDLPRNIQETAIDNFIAQCTQRIEPQTASWHGLTWSSAAYLLPLAYISGRQIRGADIPTFNELLTPTTPLRVAGDIALGWAANMFATLCHECGHAIAYRIFYKRWPESVTIGTCDSDRPALCSALRGKLALRGLICGNGVTRLNEDIDYRELRSIPMAAAGGICGITGYCGLKKLIHAIQGKEYGVDAEISARYDRIEKLAVGWENSIHRFFGLEQDRTSESFRTSLSWNQNLLLAMLPFMFDLAVWIEIKNVLLNHTDEGTDANHITMATQAQFDKLWNAVTAKIKQMRREKK